MTFPASRLFYPGAAFVWGWIYYLALPVVGGEIYINNGFPLYKDVQSLLLSINSLEYWAFCISILFSFLAGFSFFILIPLGRVVISRHNSIHPSVAIWILIVIGVAQLICYVQLRESLFQGYGGLNWNEKNAYKSFISGLNVTLGVVFLINFESAGLKRWLIIMLLGINSIVLLGLGGRMYVLIPMLAIIFQKVFWGEWGGKKILIYLGAIFSLMLCVGVLRQGNDVTRGGLWYIFLGEPVLNWVGGGNFWVMNERAAFEFPYGVIYAILGMIPTAFWPSKAQYMANLNSGFYVDNPVGGTNIIVSLLSNFGMVGSVFAIFFLGAFTGLLTKVAAKNKMMSYILSTHASLMGFMFFRDNFGIHMKCLVVNAILLPVIFVFVSGVVQGSGLQRLRKY